MSVNVTQLQERLPEILHRTITADAVCLIEQGGENVAVLLSLSQWRRTVGEQLDALGSVYRLEPAPQQRAEELLTKARLTRAERRELDGLLAAADAILLRRAAALNNL